MKSMKALFALLLALAMFATACGSDNATETVDAGEATESTDVNLTPGEGVDVTMARADWTTGYFQAEVYKLLMEDLGYNVSEPSSLELGPSLAYLSMSQGEIDFWVNSWYPRSPELARS